jgi:hypothetical protein
MGETVSSEVTAVAAATSSQDLEVGLAAVAALRGLVDLDELREAVSAELGGVTP